MILNGYGVARLTYSGLLLDIFTIPFTGRQVLPFFLAEIHGKCWKIIFEFLFLGCQQDIVGARQPG